jgi:hypothetical protein
MSDTQRLEASLGKLTQSSKTFLSNTIVAAGLAIDKLKKEQAALANALPQTVERNSMPVLLRYGDEVIELPDELLVRTISKWIPDLIRSELNRLSQQIEQVTLSLAATVIRQYQDDTATDKELTDGSKATATDPF